MRRAVRVNGLCTALHAQSASNMTHYRPSTERRPAGLLRRYLISASDHHLTRPGSAAAACSADPLLPSPGAAVRLRPRLLQLLVRRCYFSGIESRPLYFPSTFSACDIICPSWDRTPLCAARGLAIHNVFHPLGQRWCDGPAPRRHLVHHVGEGDAAIHVDNHH